MEPVIVQDVQTLATMEALQAVTETLTPPLRMEVQMGLLLT